MYETFFESYTQKVWGKPCREISAEWGAQRVKGVSLSGALLDFFSKRFLNSRNHKKVETSLIESFFYPKFGPGQMLGRDGKEDQRDGRRSANGT